MRYTVILFLFMLLFQACELGQDQTEPIIKDTANALENIKKIDNEFVTNSNTFSFNLLDKVIEETAVNENILISPLSINIALGMLYNGAKGESATQIANTLGFEGQDAASINTNYRYLLNAIPNLSNEVELSIANSVWYHDSFAVKNPFLTSLVDNFDAQVQSEDFGNSQTPVMINNWVQENTKGKIDKIIDNISPNEVMLLINALYFNGDWTYQFDPEKTTSQIFTNSLNQEKSVPMMLQEKVKVQATSGDGYSIFELPYGKEQHYALRILLPDYGKSLEEVLGQGSKLAWEGPLTLGSERNMTIGLPKFEIKDEYELNDILKSLGITDVFEPGIADLSNISDQNLNVSKVKHKTYMKVNEEGTEAAAVTSIGIELTSAPPSLICNRPFAFYIYEREMGNILFMGRIVDID